ncbi:hypothetical protein ACOMHN_034322 [Nucella lapillus]
MNVKQKSSFCWQNNPSVRLSKSLSWLLRHGAEKEGFTFLPGAFLYVDDILKKPQFSNDTVDDVKAVVSTNDKQRFHLETDEDTGRLKIRANQGHSLQVPDLDLEPITSAEQFPVVIHGTYYKFWDSIQRQGLKRMKRTHVHFAAGEPGHSGVISGMRGSCDLIIYLDLEKALGGGLKFFHSANNVILCEGNENGIISTEFFKRAIDRKTGREVDTTVSGNEPGGKAALSSASSKTRAKCLIPVTAEDLAHETTHRRKGRTPKRAINLDTDD